MLTPLVQSSDFITGGGVILVTLLAAGLLVLLVAVAVFLKHRVPQPRTAESPGRPMPGQVTWPEANRRAKQLLAKMLTTEQLRALRSKGYLAVPSPGYPGRVYHIPGQLGRITVYESGRPVSKLCVQPREHLPPADHVLLHKLMIEGDEERYLRTANQIAVSGITGH
ncbi:MAG: hypothetical protein ACE5I2_08500 [Anaerolineae bacterium]